MKRSHRVAGRKLVSSFAGKVGVKFLVHTGVNLDGQSEQRLLLRSGGTAVLYQEGEGTHPIMDSKGKS